MESIESASRIRVAYLGQGRSYHVSKWLTALSRVGLDISLISYVPPEDELEGVEVHLLKPPFSGSWKQLRLWDFLGPAAALRRLLESINPDILIASYGTNYGWMGVRSGFRPYIAQTWTADVTLYPWKGWKRFLFRPMMKRFLREAALITTDGSALESEARRLFPEHRDKIVSVRWGVRTDDYEFSEELRHQVRARMGIGEEEVVLTSARGILDWFRPKTMIPALLETLDQRPKARAIVFTHGAEPDDELLSMLEEVGVHPRGHVIDRFLSIPEMREIWNVTDAVISVPRHDGISEGLLESMYAGCIPVVSRIPSNESFLEEGESAVFVKGDPDQPSDLTSTFCSVVDNMASLKQSMVERNRQWVRNEASVDRTAEQVRDLILEVLKPDQKDN